MKKITLEQLKPGMVTAEDIYAMNGQQLLVPKGTTLTELKLQLLHVFLSAQSGLTTRSRILPKMPVTPTSAVMSPILFPNSRIK